MASSKRGFDPLEASKIVEDAPAGEPTAPAAEPLVLEEPKEIDAPAPVSAASPAKAYFLTKDFSLHWKGQLYSLKSGTLIDEETFGRGAPAV